MKKPLILFLLLAMSFVSSQAQSTMRSSNMQSAVAAFREGDKETGLKYLLNEVKSNPTNGYAYAIVASLLKEEHYKGPMLYYSDKGMRYLPKEESGMVAELACNMAELYEEGGDSVRAAAMYDRALQVNRRSKATLMNISGFYNDHNDYPAMRAKALEVIKLDKKFPNAHYAVAASYLGEKNYPAALEAVERALDCCKDDEGMRASLQGMAAQAECGMQHYDKALALVMQSLRQDLFKSAIEATYTLADSTDGQALKDSLQVLLAEKPTTSWVGMLLGDVLARKYDHTMEVYYTAKSLEVEKSADTYRSLGNIYQHYMGNPKQAEAMFRLAIEQDSTDADNYVELADFCHDMGRYDEAIGYANKALALGAGSNGSGIYYLRGRIYRDAHDYPAALADYRRQMVATPNNADYAFSAGRICLLMGDSAQAEEYFTIGRDMMGSKPLEAEHLIAMGRFDEAIAAGERDMLNGRTASTHYNLACIYAQANHPEEALRELEIAFQRGFRNFYHISWDSDLDNIRTLPAFDELLQRYQTVSLEEQKKLDELMK